MKFSVNHNRILSALRLLDHFTSKKQTLPILTSLLLKSESGRIRISATNLEMGCHVWIPAKIEEDGEVAVPSKILNNLISAVQLEKISFIVEGQVLKLNSDKQATQILCMDNKDFPIIPSAEKREVVSLPAVQLKDGLNSVFDSLALSEIRPELNGVYIYSRENSLVLASTDSFRLSERVLPIESKNSLSVILPRFAVIELMRVLDNIDEDVEIFISDNQFFAQSPNIQFVTRIVDGKFPEYTRIIPDNFQAQVRIATKEFDKQIRLVSIFCSDLNDIDLRLSEGNLSLYAKNEARGETNSDVQVEESTGDFKLSLNYQYLLDGLKNMKSDFINLKFGGEYLPFVISPVGGNDYIYLIMPLRK